MRFLVVSSPHGFTTRDVWKRVMAGLQANGQEVVPFDLLTRWAAFDMLLNLAYKAKRMVPEPFQSNLLSYEPIVGSALWHECDAAIIVSPQYFPVPIAQVLRKAGVRTIAYFTECPYEDGLFAPVQAQHFDHVLVSDRYSVGLFESFTDSVLYMPHSYDPVIHYRNGDERDRRVVWVGTAYGSRRDFLKAVDWKGVDLDLYGIWHGANKRSRWAKFLRGEIVENEAVAELYRHSGMSFSIHRVQRYWGMDWTIDDGEAYSAGPRTYELAACGCFQISDFRQEVVDLFGDSIPIYNSPAEFGALMRRAVADPVWRDDLARQQWEAVQGHDCSVTMRRLLERVAA